MTSQIECGETRTSMRDEQLLLNLAEIATWLDNLALEVNKIKEMVQETIVGAPVSLDAWDKVGEQIWSN